MDVRTYDYIQYLQMEIIQCYITHLSTTYWQGILIWIVFVDVVNFFSNMINDKCLTKCKIDNNNNNKIVHLRCENWLCWPCSTGNRQTITTTSLPPACMTRCIHLASLRSECDFSYVAGKTSIVRISLSIEQDHL